jgi:hypothetical protein
MRALLLLLTCLGLLCVLWTQVVAPAREAARRIQCDTTLFQHTGWHPSDIVSLDQNGAVVSVSSCPLCSTTTAPIIYRSRSGVIFRREELPPQTIEAARKKLAEFKAEPRYRSIRTSLLGADETLAEQTACAR